MLVCTFSERSGAGVSRRDRVRHDDGDQRLRVDGLEQRIVADRDVGASATGTGTVAFRASGNTSTRREQPR